MPPENIQNNNLNGIRGWLILTVISLIITPIISLLYILFELTTYFEPDYWYNITTYGTEFYHPLFAPMIIYELAINIALIFIPIFLLLLMFKKKPYFPRLMIVYLIAGVALHCVDSYFVYSVFSNVPAFDGAMVEIEYMLLKDTMRIVMSAVIWVPYFIYSKRVKATFLGWNNKETSYSKNLNSTITFEAQNKQPLNKKRWLPIFSYVVNFILVIMIFFIWYSNNNERKILEHSNSILSQEKADLEETHVKIKEEISNKETNNFIFEEEKKRLLNDLKTLQEENTSILSDLKALREENTKLQNDINSLQERSIAATTPEPNKSSSDPVKENTASADLIDIGSTQEDVKRIMGTPSAIQDYSGFFTVWNYGSSTIQFDENGKVEGWRNYGNNLKLK